MAIINSADQLVVVLVFLVMLFFLIKALFIRLTKKGKLKKASYDDYLFASRKLSKNQIRDSTAATYTAFATVFFWFIVLGAIYSWLLFLIPVFLFIGNYLFTKIVKWSGVKLGKFSTISSYISSKSSFKPLHYITDGIVVVFLFSILLVEIVIGSGILGDLMPNVPGGQLFFLVLLSLLTISYVVIGGFRMVIMSDRTQLYLTFAGVIALLIFSLGYLKIPIESNFFHFPNISFSALAAFLVSVVAIQIFGPLCQLQNWQRISGSKDQKKALSAHRQGALLGAILWSLMIIVALILFVKLKGNVSFNTIFSVMKTGNVLSAYILYPLLFISFVAAMISTADSAMAALYLLLYDKIKTKKKRKFSPSNLLNILVGLGLFFLILSIYIINKTNIQNFAITIIYFLFNQLIVIFPVLFFFIIENKIMKKKKAKVILTDDRRGINRNLMLAVLLGWLTVLLMAGIGFITGSLNWTMFASASGVAVVFLISIPSWIKLYRAKESKISD